MWSWYEFAVKALHHLIVFMFPSVCPICGAQTSVHGEFCGDCWPDFNWIDGTKCSKCGYPFMGNIESNKIVLCPICAAGKCELDLIRSACVYDDISRGIMLPFKHGGKTKYAYAMSRAMIWAMRDTDIVPDVVMPVPLAYRRLVHRTYNQATLLARPIAHAYGARLDVSSVRRAYRPDMGHKNARQRAENIHGVFRITHPEKVRGKRILLVDDVMTTGATFSELRRVLKRAGASSVYGVTFCRVARTT